MADAFPYVQADVGNGVVLRLLPRGKYRVSYTPSQPVAGFAFESQYGWHAFSSDRVRTFRAAANGLAFTPAGCSVFSEAPEGGEYLTLTGDPARLASLAGDEDASGLPDRQFTGRIHPQSVRAAVALRRRLLSGEVDPAALECAVVPFLDALRSAAGRAAPPSPSARSLTPRRLKIVEELVEARIAEPLTIGDMAAACRLSTGFFLRAFKAATGQTPHSYLMARRVASARLLLRATRIPAAEIAVLTGFCSQAHMTVSFSNSIGVTPAVYRAAVTCGKIS